MSNSPKMECLENYIVKYIHVTGRANFFTDNNLQFHSQSTSYFKNKLINEILENRVILGENFNKYLELVSHRINTETNFVIEEIILDDWRVTYHLDDFAFKPKSTADLKASLHSLGSKLKFLNEDYITPKDKSIVYDIYEFHISSIEIIDFIDKYLVDKKPVRVKENLPVFQNVFFIHYQCDDFNVSDKIESLSIYANDKAIVFKDKTEAENIEEYCETVNKLLDKGLIPVHWSQNRPYYGVNHITSRYFKLTGKQIVLEYKNSLNLSGIVKHKFGEEYVSHPRLDNLAKINIFNGISSKEKGLRTFDANRVLLLSKIYFGVLNNSLKIGTIKEDDKKNTDESTVITNVTEENDPDNYLISTIEDYLEEFKSDINGNGYEILIDALFVYFTSGAFPLLENKIKFKKINKKRVGWALKELYKSEKTDNLDIEYFRFARENINLFEKEIIVTENFNKSNFYKAFTSNPAK